VSDSLTRYRQLEALERRDEILDVNPAVLYVESVRGCPYSCAMCAVRGTDPHRISRDVLRRLEPYYPDLEVLAVQGSGEPLLGDLEYFVEKAAAHDIVLHINTTGFFLTRRMAELLLAARLSVRFSIHAGRSDTYHRIMGGDFRRVLENIAYLIDLADRSPQEQDFWFSYLVMKENLDEIEEFLQLAHACGIRSVRFMRLRPNRRTARGVVLPERDFRFKHVEQSNRAVLSAFRQRLPRYRSLAGELGIRIESGTMDTPGRDRSTAEWLVDGAARKIVGRRLHPLRRRRGRCVAPWIGQLIVGQDASVKLCCVMHDRLGNLRDSTLGDLWNSETARRIRRAFAEGFIPRECGFCRGFGLANYPRNAFPEADRAEGREGLIVAQRADVPSSSGRTHLTVHE